MSLPAYTKEFQDVLDAERARIAELRRARGMGPAPSISVALSGGGIRAAAFGLGVLQAIAACRLFPMVDYLSTVSGGGFTGTALTWFLRNGRATFPFANGDPNTPLDRLRRQADYLSPTARLTLTALLAVVLQKAFLSLSVYGALLVGFFFLFDAAGQALRPLQALLSIYTTGTWTDRLVLSSNPMLLASAGAVAALLAQVVWLTFQRAADHWWRRGGGAAERAYVRRRRAAKRAGVLLQVAATTFVVGTVPAVAGALAAWSGRPWGWTDVGTVLLGLALCAAVVRARPSLVTPLVCFGLLYAFLLATHAVALQLVFGGAPWTVLVVGGGALLMGAITSLDAHGSADVFRDRLAEAFMPDPGKVADPRGLPAHEAARYPLAAACGPTTTGPYHLLNAALLTPASSATRWRQRGADAFVLSPLYCGSGATGWRTTASWKRGSVTLAAAMATSAAAVDPYAAPAGSGATRGSLLSLVLALCGLRLGHVEPHPRLEPPARHRRFPPNLLFPGLRLAVFGQATETGRWVTLADGGDFDDLGVYELIRRRVPLIVAVDASEDPAWTFAALGNLVERVRVDFGVEITFEDLETLRARPGAPAHVVGCVHRPANGGDAGWDGCLVYVRAKLLPDAPADVIARARSHPAFPHESTLDQFFDESTFEAYRSLGFLVGYDVLDDPRVALALTSSQV